jgi:hypothetical protein
MYLEELNIYCCQARHEYETKYKDPPDHYFSDQSYSDEDSWEEYSDSESCSSSEFCENFNYYQTNPTRPQSCDKNPKEQEQT